MSAANLHREIVSAFRRGWYLCQAGYPRRLGCAEVTRLENAGWNSCARGESCAEGLERFMAPFEERPERSEATCPEV